MVKNKIDTMSLDSLNLEELSGVVSIYPWFASARVELCRRMAQMGGEESWGEDKYALQALYVPSRKKIYDIIKSAKKKTGTSVPLSKPTKSTKQIYVIGGDYFSAEQYAQARRDDDNIFASFISNAIENSTKSTASTYVESTDSTDFCTEELAKVYLEQGYPDKAKQIYSKLSLRIPEKSIYFASLIEKIDK